MLVRPPPRSKLRNCHATNGKLQIDCSAASRASSAPRRVLRQRLGPASLDTMKKMNSKQSLLLSGDFWQLPCINESQIYDNYTGVKSEEYEKFEIRELTKNFRQKEDAEFFSLCNKLRGKLSKDEAMDVLKVLNSRVVSTLPDNTSMDDIHICGVNEQVYAVNRKYKLKVDCKVICNMGCKDKENKTVPNGSIGIVKSMIPFIIEWGDKSISTFKGLGKTKSNKPRFAPAYGLTVHKAQGKTIKRNVIINPTRFFTRNHLYVALTRATKFSSIYFTEKMSFKTFCNTVNVDTDTITPITQNRLKRMLKTYIVEEPKLTLKFLQDMRDRQQNKCCYCEVGMCDLFGQSHSLTLERIDDSKCHILSNIKFACFGCNSLHRKQ